MILSCEMLEHMKKNDMVLKKVSSWLKPDGRMMVQIRKSAVRLRFQDHRLDGQVFLRRRHHAQQGSLQYFLPPDLKQTRFGISTAGSTAEPSMPGWPNSMRTPRKCLRVEGGPTSASVALQRWRMFPVVLLGSIRLPRRQRWMVFHYLFEKSPAAHDLNSAFHAPTTRLNSSTIGHPGRRAVKVFSSDS